MRVSVALASDHPNFPKAVSSWYIDRCQGFIGDEIESYLIVPLQDDIFTIKFSTKKTLDPDHLEILKETLSDPDSIDRYHIRWNSVYGFPIDYKYFFFIYRLSFIPGKITDNGVNGTFR